MYIYMYDLNVAHEMVEKFREFLHVKYLKSVRCNRIAL